MSEDFVKNFLLPRLDQLESEVKVLREITWPVCQALREEGDPLKDSHEKRRFFQFLFKEEALELLKRKAQFEAVTDKVILDQELDLICSVKDKTHEQTKDDC